MENLSTGFAILNLSTACGFGLICQWHSGNRWSLLHFDSCFFKQIPPDDHEKQRRSFNQLGPTLKDLWHVFGIFGVQEISQSFKLPTVPTPRKITTSLPHHPPHWQGAIVPATMPVGGWSPEKSLGFRAFRKGVVPSSSIMWIEIDNGCCLDTSQ